MPRQLWIADALRNAGLHVVEQPGWKERGSTLFDPHGVVCHHTASSAKAGDVPSLKVVIAGRPDLAGPLCQVLIGRSGACHVIAAGKANHAGEGKWKTLTGNASVLGIEAENDGIGEPWSAHLVDVFERCAAALAKGCLATAEMVCGHKEWTLRKIDPAGIDMAGFRSAVAQLLHQTPEDDDMPDANQVEAAKLETIEGWYRYLLGRDPAADPKGCRYWLGRLDAAEAHVVRREFLAAAGAG